MNIKINHGGEEKTYTVAEALLDLGTWLKQTIEVGSMEGLTGGARLFRMGVLLHATSDMLVKMALNAAEQEDAARKSGGA
jgi:hypothetical protein